MALPTSPIQAQFRDLIDQVCTLTAVSLTPAPAGITAGTTSTATVTVNGAALGDRVDVTCTTALGGLIVQGEVTAANTVTVKFANISAGTVTPGALVYNVIVYKRTAVCFS